MAREREDLATRFWACVDVREPNECWPWLKSTHGGYGQFRLDYVSGRAFNAPAHRVAHELTLGTVPKGQVVHRTCRNRLCCNPVHFVLWTLREVALDRETRISPRARRGGAKLSARQVRAIRLSSMETRQLSRRYGVTPRAISNIRRGMTWQ